MTDLVKLSFNPTEPPQFVKYPAPFWRKQLLIGTSHPVIALVHEYERAERERDLRKNLGNARLMTPDQLFKEFRDGDTGE